MPPSSTDAYGSVAGIYDPLTAALLDPLRRELTRQAQHLEVNTVLDLCCGTGRQLAMLHSAGLRCAGVDLSEAMLAQARIQCPKDVELLKADATATPYPEGSFDLCTIAFALHERPHAIRLGLLAEAQRVLTPCGTIFVLDYRMPRSWVQRLGHLGVWLFERAAGGEHYASYRQYLRSGGLGPLAKQAGLTGALLGSYRLNAIGLYAFTKNA